MSRFASLAGKTHENHCESDVDALLLRGLGRAPLVSHRAVDVVRSRGPLAERLRELATGAGVGRRLPAWRIAAVRYRESAPWAFSAAPAKTVWVVVPSRR